MSANAPARPRSWQEWVSLLARLAAGLVLVISGGIKARSFAGSANAVKAYVLMPDSVAEIVGYALPVVEIIVGLLLLAGLFTRLVAALEVALMVVFIAGIASLWVRGMRVDCGCFGGGGVNQSVGPMTYLSEILRDLAFCIPGVWLLIRPRSPFAVDNWLNRDLDALHHDPAPETDED